MHVQKLSRYTAQPLLVSPSNISQFHALPHLGITGPIPAPSLARIYDMASLICPHHSFPFQIVFLFAAKGSLGIQESDALSRLLTFPHPPAT